MTGSRVRRSAAVALAVCLGVGVTAAGNEKALSLRASVVGGGAAGPALTIDLVRWSTDVERAPLLTALAAPVPAPAPPAGAAGGRTAGRGGRGGRGVPPPSPTARLTTAVKAAPTVGFIWGEGPTGYSIKYAWQASVDGGQRVVLVIDRRLGAHQPLWPSTPAAADDGEFTVLEMRLDGKGHGEVKTSLGARVVIDSAAQTLALDGYAAAPTQLKVTP